MKVPTMKVYKGRDTVVINKSDLKKWNDLGYVSSSQRKSSKKEEKPSEEDE